MTDRQGLTIMEARQTLCPIVTNKFQDMNEMQSCVAANCMAWRWVDPAMTNEPPHVTRPMADQRRGFCGLAGTINTIREWDA